MLAGMNNFGLFDLFRTMPSAWTVLVTGGAGFVGSHTVVALLEANYTVIVIDNLHNAYKGCSVFYYFAVLIFDFLAPDAEKPEILERVEKIAGRKTIFYDVDIMDEVALTEIFLKVRLLSFDF